ncbi:hypothetical protein [Streptomyces sp. SID10815]|nr:hypothetical protein [Streptomyces sp. SID10815]NEA50473.1 hypothetical protein [Streptomyces sp. SID10815]
MTPPDDWAFEALLDLLNDPEFDVQLLLAVEEFCEVEVCDLDWMLT